MFVCVDWGCCLSVCMWVCACVLCVCPSHVCVVTCCCAAPRRGRRGGPGRTPPPPGARLRGMLCCVVLLHVLYKSFSISFSYVSIFVMLCYYVVVSQLCVWNYRARRGTVLIGLIIVMMYCSTSMPSVLFVSFYVLCYSHGITGPSPAQEPQRVQ